MRWTGYRAACACLTLVAIAGLGALAWERRPGQTLVPHGPMASGRALVDKDLLQQGGVSHLPPPPLDAIPYEIASPLFNSPSVLAKKRWIWVPPGSRVTLTRSESGWAAAVPEGVKFWKEFYVDTPGGVVLMERRVSLATRSPREISPGWEFLTSHGEVPQEPLLVPSSASQRMLFSPGDWLPVRTSLLPAQVEWTALAGGPGDSYVFPGQGQCHLCHGGADGQYAPSADPVLAFGLRPESLTASSLALLQESGRVEIRGEVDSPPPASLGERLVYNCVSCHNPSALASGRHTGFVLDPRIPLDPQLLGLIGKRTVLDPPDLPLVVPGSPEQSELSLRVWGTTRRRMPPWEGGVPHVDQALARWIDEWIAGLGKGS